MVAYTSAPIVDPDFLTYSSTTNISTSWVGATTEIVIDYANKLIGLKVTGNLTTDGSTLKCVYSKLKEIWRTDTSLVKFPFPMGPITDEQFEMINGWNWDSTQTSGVASQNTVELLRTGGWSVVNTSGVITEKWACIITLGTFVEVTDQAYFQQSAGGVATNFKLTNNVNQSIRFYYDPNGDGSTADGYNYSGYMKVFLREYAKTFSQAANTDIGASNMTYQAYRFPLTNAVDLKITHNDAGVSTTAPYTNVNITYLRDAANANSLYNVRGDYNPAATAYALSDVVKDTVTNRWFKCVLAYTSGATQPAADATHWASYEGERLIGTTYYAFKVVIDGDTTAGTYISGVALRTQIYEKVQYSLRQNSDIDASLGTVVGKTADPLLKFVGDTLVTYDGVYIDSFNSLDTNDIEFFDALSVKRTFPYVATLTINFGDNLVNDPNAKYWAFFSTLPGVGNDYGEVGAVLVKNKDSVDMTGTVSGASSISWTFDYDNNVQGGRTPAADAAVTVVSLGLSTGQYVKATGVIARSKANSVTLTSSLERNYFNPV